MATSRSKRWNGSVDTLPAEYLKGVMAKMGDYGDRVQFSLISGGPQPSYQVMNTFGKTMVFNKDHHLTQSQAEDFIGVNASTILTLDKIQAAINGVGISSGSTRTRTTRSSGTSTGGVRTTAARLEDQAAAERYEYFKKNRDMLPPEISRHSNEIADLMKKGKSVDDAFSEIFTKYF